MFEVLREILAAANCGAKGSQPRGLTRYNSAARPTPADSFRQCRSPFPGNGILRGRDNGVEKARHIQSIVSRDKTPARNAANSAPYARHREISVCRGLRGGPGRTRTANQTIISYLAVREEPISPVAKTCCYLYCAP